MNSSSPLSRAGRALALCGFLVFYVGGGVFSTALITKALISLSRGDYRPWNLLVALALILYSPSYLDKSEERGNREWMRFRLSRFFRWVVRRHRMKLVWLQPEQELPSQVMFTCANHGLSPMGWMSLFLGGLKRHMPLFVGASILFRIPWMRECLLWSGGINATESAIRRALKNRRSILIFPVRSNCFDLPLKQIISLFFLRAV